MFKTFQSALFASFIGLILLCLFIFTVLAIPRIKTATVNQISSELFKQTLLVSAGLSENDSLTIQNKVLEIAKLSGSRVTVIAKDGKVLGDSATTFAELGTLENHLDRPEIIEAQKQGKGKAVRYSATLGKDLIYVAVPLQGEVGYVRFAIPATYATELVIKIHKSIAAALAVVILVAVVLSMLFSRSFAHPIIRLSGISGRITRGEFPVKIVPRSKFEIGKLEAAIEDISERLAESFKKLSKEQGRLEKLGSYRSEFVANVSHELKTPLTAIRSYVETLIEGAIDDKEHNRDFLNKIDKHVSHLSCLIDDILEISKLESKKELEPFDEIDVSKVIERVLDTIAERIKEKKIDLVKKCDISQCFIPGLEDHIYRALLNILDNAINYTGSGGRIELSCKKVSNKLELIVSDTGIGIPQKHLSRVFERFYRVDKARSRQLGGTGLGLSIVKHVMNIHHGTVEVESEVGKGSKFTLVFPPS